MKKTLFMMLAIAAAVFNCKDKDANADPVPTKPPAQKESVVEISTSFGKMYVWLYKETPLHRENFLKLVTESFFDGTTFHRVIPGFMIQGGDPNSKDSDPNNDGQGGPGYTIQAEIRDTIKHVRGALAAARMPDSVNPTKASSGSQFYIAVSTSGTAGLNGNYTVFGYVMKGMEVADAIVSQPRNGNDRPNTDIQMTVKLLKQTKAEIQAQYGYTVK